MDFMWILHHLNMEGQLFMQRINIMILSISPQQDMKSEYKVFSKIEFCVVGKVLYFIPTMQHAAVFLL